MYFGSKYVYLGNEQEDEEQVKVSEIDDVVLSDSSDVSDDDGETCLLDILDTAGQEEYSSMKDQYVRTGSGFAIIYSIVDKESFKEAEAIHRWLKRLRTDGSCHVVLIANKQDLKGEATVTEQEGRELAQKLSVPFYETSAKDGSGVTDAMKGLVRIIPREGSDYKIVMLGSGAVGKSSITLRFVNNVFVDDYDPTIEDSYRKMINVDGLNAVSKDHKKAVKKAKRLKKRQPQPDLKGSPLGQRQQAAPQRRSRPASGGGFVKNMRNSLMNALGRSTQSQAMNASVSPPPSLPPRIGIDSQSSPQTVLKKQKKTDGNVVLLSMGTLEEEPKLVTGDPIKCSNCDVVLTETAVLEADGDKKVWNCEFCGHANRNLDIEDDELPKGDCFDYMLSPATEPEPEAACAAEETKKEKTTSGVIVYCMDISSSMQASCEIPESQSSWRQERLGTEDVNRVSRLACIQTAVERLAEQLKAEQPEKKILLVVFSSEVFVKAGGSMENLPKFSVDSVNYEQLLAKGEQLYRDYPLQSLEDSYDGLIKAVRGLTTTGCTALGPALSICVGFASSIPGSEVVLCTDGEPNVGVGSLNNGNNRDGDHFYETVGNYGLSKNVTINILAVEGASVGLQSVSKAAERSGGTTNKLNPAEIVRQLRIIAQNEVVATSVTVRFFLHPDFVFDEPEYVDTLSQLEKEVGSARKETDLTFRFKLRDQSKAMDLKEVPFQVHITYTRPNGMKCLRVLSKKNEATSSRKDMEENIAVNVMSVATMKSTAQLANKGKGLEAQHLLKNMKRMVHRGAKTSEQREARLGYDAALENWEDQLTFANDIYEMPTQCDVASNNIQMAQVMNINRSDVGNSKFEKVMARKKMNVASKAAYYGYKNNLM